MVIKQKNLVEFQIYYLMVVEMLIDLLHFPDIIRYILDVNAIALILMGLPKIKNIVNDKVFKKYNTYVFAFMFIIIAFSFIRRTPAGQIVWAARNNYLNIIFLFVCAYTLKQKDIYRILDNVEKLQILNVICVIYEYFILHKYGDNVGGMFGTASGCNGYLNIYIAFITAYVFTKYSNKKTSILNVLWISLSSMVIAVSAELKFYFFELIVILILSITLSRLSAKNGLLIVAGIIAVYIGFQVLTTLFPESASLLMDVDELNSYASTSYGDKLISRATPFSQVNDYFFKGNIFYILFGYGFGACEDSVTFKWANSDFATVYGHLKYRNLSTSMNFLETGAIGLIAFVAIFVILFQITQKQKQKMPEHRHMLAFNQTAAALTILNIWYNASIRRPIGFFIFFCLSTVIVLSREKQQQERLEIENQEKPPETPKKSYFKNKNKRVWS
ncbi:MAG: hypothetical protein IJR70_06220 [Eubacterium sp.]|nr:hypothetical protein [Eubacterium sp.]